MSRPLIRLGVGQLQELFSKSSSDPKVLMQLEQELKHRSALKANELLAQVRTAVKALAGGGAAAASRQALGSVAAAHSKQSAQAIQPDLWTAKPQAGSQGQDSSEAGQVTARPAKSMADGTVYVSGSAPATSTASEQTRPNESGNFSVTPAQAYKLLEANASTPWQEIELMRWKIVQRSHPGALKSARPEQRQSALHEAQKANSAYAVLLRERYPKL